MIKVIQFIGSLSDGGAETLVKDYSLFFNNRVDLGVKNIVVTVNNYTNSANYKRLRESNVEIITIYNKHSITNRILRVCFGKFYIPYKLAQIIKDIKPDCIHVHLALLKYLKSIHKQLQGIKLFYTCHSRPELYFQNKNEDEGIAADILIRECNLKMIALHNDMANTINSMFNINNTMIIKNGVDLNKFKNITESPKDIRESIGLPSDAFVLGHIGRFTEAKNHIFLLKIFQNVLNRKRNAYLLLIGSGPLYLEIQEKSKILGISDRIIFLSHRTDIPQLLKAMDVFVFPSLYEGMPVTLIEAQASHVKCVISDTINKQVILSPYTFVCSLNSSLDDWANIILNENISNNDFADIKQYDMNTEIENLAKLYHS